MKDLHQYIIDRSQIDLHPNVLDISLYLQKGKERRGGRARCVLPAHITKLDEHRAVDLRFLWHASLQQLKKGSCPIHQTIAFQFVLTNFPKTAGKLFFMANSL